MHIQNKVTGRKTSIPSDNQNENTQQIKDNQ